MKQPPNDALGAEIQVPANASPASATLAPPPVNAAYRPYKFAPVTLAGETAQINTALATEHGRLDSHFQGAHQETLDAAATQASEVVGVATAKHLDFLGELKQRKQTARTIFATSRATVGQVAASQTALARADAEAAIVRLREDCARQRSEAIAAAKAEGQRMRSMAKESGVRVLRSGLTTRERIHADVGVALKSAEQIEDADDKAAVQSSLRGTSSELREELTDHDLANHDTLKEKAAENERTFIAEANGLFEERDAKLGELEQATISTGEAVVARIAQLQMRQLLGLSRAERDYIAKLDQLEAGAGKILEAGGLAAQRVNAVARAQVATLQNRQLGAHASLDRVAREGAAKLAEGKLPPQQIKQGSKLVRTELTKLGAEHLAASQESHSTELALLSNASSRFGALLDERVATLASQLDGAQGQVTQTLSESTNALTLQCSTDRATAETMYLGAFTQLSTPSWTKVQEARATWREKADQFGADIKQAADGAIGKHGQIVAGLPEKLSGVADDTVKERHQSWLTRNLPAIWNAFKTFVKGLGLLLLGVAALTIFGIGIGLALALVGLLGLAVGFYHRMKALIAQWGDWPWYSKLAGIVGTAFASAGDLVGLTGGLEAIFGYEAVTGRKLSESERVERFTLGALTAITAGLMKWAMPKVGAGGSGGRAPAGELPPGEPGVGEGTVTDPAATETPPAAENGQASAKPAEQTAAPEGKPAEQTSAQETKPAEQAPAAETKPAEQAPAAETKPAEQAPAKDTKPTEPATSPENKPAEQTAADNKPPEQMPAQDTKPSGQTTSPENKPAEQTTSATESKPAEATNTSPNKPAESKPADTTSAPETKPKTPDPADANASAAKAADLKSGDSKTAEPSTERADGRRDAKGSSDEAAPKSAEEAAGAVSDAYSAFAKKHGLSEARAAQLRAAGVDLKRLEALIKGGKHPAKSPEVAAQTALDEIQLAQRLERFGVAKGKGATKVARAAGDAGIIDTVNELLSHVGKRYRNPEDLGPVLEAIGDGHTQHMQALNDALARMRRGHEVSIEAEADVVDHTTKEAIQHKEIQSDKRDQLNANIKKAASQLAGETGEVPPPGYERVADVRVKPSSPWYKKSAAEIHTYLKEMKASRDRLKSGDIDADPNADIAGLASDLEIRVTNANGTFRFRGPDFDPILDPLP